MDATSSLTAPSHLGKTKARPLRHGRTASCEGRRHHRRLHEETSIMAMREAFAALDVMPGFRAELVGGEIIVSPPPDGQHETIVVAVDDWVRDVHGLRLHRNLTLISPEGEYVPDGIAAPKGAFAGRDWHSKPDGVVMVLEVTSGRRGSARPPNVTAARNAGVRRRRHPAVPADRPAGRQGHDLLRAPRRRLHAQRVGRPRRRPDHPGPVRRRPPHGRLRHGRTRNPRPHVAQRHPGKAMGAALTGGSLP